MSENMNFLRAVEHIHGHAGWLAVAALVHPAILLRKRGKRAHLSVGLGAAIVTTVASVGIWLYVPYRDALRPGIFQSAPEIGLMFERKEHLAFGVVLASWLGALAYFGSWRAEDETRIRLHALSHRAFVIAAVLAGAVASLGTYVATYRTF
jgi:hypothetical protein